ncbi:hypothetical protein Q3G72_023228 [Acer saccharum]|nr:hypothetical protein Q3G72_023228 [Acer saccharum]
MHIYGWPITAKVADVGWNNRKTLDRKVPTEARRFNGNSRSVRMDRRDHMKREEVRPRRVFQQEKRSFVEIVKEDMPRDQGNEGGHSKKSLTMTWFGDSEVEVEDWLSRSAIGKLKEFASVEQLGGLVGELMWIDEETLNKTRLDKGRFLILVSPEKQISPEKLGLKPSKSSLDIGGEPLECKEASGRGEWGLVERCQEKSGRVRGKVENRGLRGQNLPRDGNFFEYRKEVADKTSLPKSWYLKRKAAGLNVQTVEKGKGKWMCRSKPKSTRIPNPKGGIIIGASGSDQYFPSSSEDTSSLGEEPAGRHVFSRGAGECSKVIGPSKPVIQGLTKDRSMSILRPSIGLQEKGLLQGPNREITDSSSQEGVSDTDNAELENREVSSPSFDINQLVSKKGIQRKNSFQEIGLCVDLSGQGADPNILGTGDKSHSQDTVVAETQMEDLGVDKEMGFKKVKRRGAELLTRTHPMKTRCSLLKPISGIKKIYIYKTYDVMTDESASVVPTTVFLYQESRSPPMVSFFCSGFQ